MGHVVFPNEDHITNLHMLHNFLLKISIFLLMHEREYKSNRVRAHIMRTFVPVMFLANRVKFLYHF